MKELYDYLILGAGPAGLQVGYEAMKSGHDYLILEKESAGCFFKKYPRHRKLLSINKVYTGYEDTEVNLRWDWNSLLCDSEQLLFKNYSKRYLPDADDLVRYLEDFARHYQLKIETGVNIVHITRHLQGFILTGSDGKRFHSKKLIIATGVTKENLPPIPGAELCEKYSSVSVDPENFVNQRVLIIGKGNTAFEIADNLIETTAYINVISPEPLRLAWQSRFVGDLRAVNNNFLDTYQLKCQNAILDGIVTNIEKKEDGSFSVSVSYSHAEGEAEMLEYDRIIMAAGFRFDPEIFDAPCQPRMTINNRYPELTPHFESINVPDLFFAGTVTQSLDYRKSTSSFIHGFRYNARALMRYLNNRFHDIPWPHATIKIDPESFTEKTLTRINRTSALWQQFGFLSDVIQLGVDSATYHEEVPREYALKGDFLINKDDHCILITLEFGGAGANPFAIERKPMKEYAHESSFLHPIIRHYHKGKLVNELHILEDLHARWDKEIHITPLKNFFEDALSAINGPIEAPGTTVN